jgi:hypothetical protein
MNVNETLWKVLTKISSSTEGWVKITTVLDISPVGCLVNVSTGRTDGQSDAEAVTFVPGVKYVVTDGVPSLEVV